LGKLGNENTLTSWIVIWNMISTQITIIYVSLHKGT